MANNICIIKLGRIKSLERRDNMFFWKIDDETIRCLINKEEIGQMGFDLKELGENNEQMEEFLNAVIADSKNFIPSSLYKKADKYILLVEFPVEMDNSQIITFMITAEEYGAECSNQRLEGYYLSEHAKLIIKEKAVETLFRMN